MDYALMNGLNAQARSFPRAIRCRAATGILIAFVALLLWSGCKTAHKTRLPVQPAAPAGTVAPKPFAMTPASSLTIPTAPAASIPSPARQMAPAPGIVAVGPEATATRLTMSVESEPAGATIVVDGRPVGKTPLQLGVPATSLGFFSDYVEIRARFIADSEAEVSQTATEEFSPREKVPALLRFTPAGARRTLRSE